jgi:hypothetical protein
MTTPTAATTVIAETRQATTTSHVARGPVLVSLRGGPGWRALVETPLLARRTA